MPTLPKQSGSDPALVPDIIVERDDGLFEIGLCPDAPGPFETRAIAEAVAAQEFEDAA